MKALFLSHDVTIDDFRIRGFWRGGVSTSLLLQNEKIIFDMGPCFLEGMKADTLVLSHSHADHCFGLPFWLSRRQMEAKTKGRVFLHHKNIDKVQSYIQAAEKLDGATFNYELIPMKPGEEIEIKKNLFLLPLEAIHHVNCLSFVLFEKVKKLKAEFLNLPQNEIIDLKKSGTNLTETIHKLRFAFATDTEIEVFDKNPILYQAPILFLECTFPVDENSIEVARAGKHIHYLDILKRKGSFKNKHLVFGHFSQRYQSKELGQFKTKMEDEFKETSIHLFHPYKI